MRWPWTKYRQRAEQAEARSRDFAVLLQEQSEIIERYTAEQRALAIDAQRRLAVRQAHARLMRVWCARWNALVRLDGVDDNEATERLGSEPLMHAALALEGALRNVENGHLTRHADALLILAELIAPEGDPLGAAVDYTMHLEGRE